MGLDAVELVITIEERFAIAIDDADVSQVRTVGDLERLVAKKLLPQDGKVCLTRWAMVLAALPAMGLAYKATVPLAVQLPPECSTVGQATGAILALNFGRIARDRQAWSDKELWNSLRSTIVERLGVKPAEVTRDARLVADLGVD